MQSHSHRRSLSWPSTRSCNPLGQLRRSLLHSWLSRQASLRGGVDGRRSSGPRHLKGNIEVDIAWLEGLSRLRAGETGREEECDKSRNPHKGHRAKAQLYAISRTGRTRQNPNYKAWSQMRQTTCDPPAERLPEGVSPAGLNTATSGRVKCSHPEEVWRS